MLMQVVMGVLTFSTVDWSVVASCSPVILMCRSWDSVGIGSPTRKLQSECGLRCWDNVCVRGGAEVGHIYIQIGICLEWEICCTTMSHTSKQSGMAGLTINEIN